MEVNSPYRTPWAPDAPIDWTMHNKGITPIFSIEPVSLFEADGKTPRLGADGKSSIDMEFVTIVIAGDGLAEASHPVDDLIKERFEDEYKAWKEGREAAHQGHTVEEWPAIFSRRHGDLPPPKLIAELHANNIFTVEGLAALADVNLHSIHHGRELREKAIAWLADKEGHAVTDELAKQNAAMQVELEAIRRQMAMAAARKPKKRVRSKETRRKISAIRQAGNAVRKAPVPPDEQPPPEAA
jgi:hypothetical protein